MENRRELQRRWVIKKHPERGVLRKLILPVSELVLELAQVSVRVPAQKQVLALVQSGHPTRLSRRMTGQALVRVSARRHFPPAATLTEGLILPPQALKQPAPGFQMQQRSLAPRPTHASQTPWPRPALLLGKS